MKIVDFSGYNEITTEKVKRPMKNYWDSSPFTEEIGNKILEKVLNTSSNIEFGNLITPDNIEDHLIRNRKKQIIYQKNNQKIIKELHIMYKKALNGDRQNKQNLIGSF